MNRYNSIDILKFICAFLVILIHASYPYKSEVIPITDVAVPLFFCISGFFIYGKGCDTKRIKRIAILILWSFALYFIKTELFHILVLKQVYFLSFKNWIDLLVFNDVAFSIHLWYLPAYLYSLFVVYAIEKYDKWDFSFWFIIPLLIVGTIIKLNVPGPQIQYHRNFLFFGLPHVLTGAYIKKIISANALFVNKLIGGGKLFCLIIVFYILRYNIPDIRYLSSFIRDIDLFLLVVSIFLFTLSFKDTNTSIWTKLGRDYSLYIYVFHLLILSVIEMMQSHIPEYIWTPYSYIHPVIVLFISIAVTYILKKIKVIK